MSARFPGLPGARRGRRSVRALRVLAGAAAAVLVFLVGMALGRATAGDQRGGTATLVRTLVPLTVEPARQTVTVTVTNSG